MSASSYQREAVKLRAQLREADRRRAAAEERAKAIGADLVRVSTERDALRLERHSEQRDAARVRETMANAEELEVYRQDAWQDQLEAGEDAPAAGWPEQVADPELYVASRLGLARTTYAPKAAPAPQQKAKADDGPGAIERHLGTDRAAIHRTLVNGGGSAG